MAGPPRSRPAGFVRTVVQAAVRPARRNLLHWASWIVALSIELAILILLRHEEIYPWELEVARHLQSVPGKQYVFDVTSTLTNTLSIPFLLLFLVITAAVFIWGERIAAAVLLLSFPLHVLAQFPKALIDRPRPSSDFPGIEGVGGVQSFPSGHAEYVVTFYGFLAVILMMRARSWRSRSIIFLVWLVFALATGFGRVALGRHWPIDVLVSYVVGLGLLSGLVWLHSALSAGAAPGGEGRLSGQRRA
ncbi:MAG: phosphatase PAP2 family protein [Dehalococcoidia bacterium]